MKGSAARHETDGFRRRIGNNDADTDDDDDGGAADNDIDEENEVEHFAPLAFLDVVVARARRDVVLTVADECDDNNARVVIVSKREKRKRKEKQKFFS